jgi:hypothetical protein
MSRIHRPSPAVVIAFTAVVLAIGGFAFAAAIPDRNGVIHACYKKKKGALRVVRAGKHCSRRERPLAWNQRGRTGPRGRTGSRGRTGRTGSRGPTGPAGSAVAYAQVNGGAATGGDTVNSAKAKNVSDSQVTHPATGLYCFYLSFTPANVVATADWVSNGTNVLSAASLSDSPSCPNVETASVTLRNVEAATDKDGNFFVAFN